MLDRNMKRLFEESDQMVQIDKEKKRKAMTDAGQMMKSERKSVCADRISIILNQSRYMDKAMLWIQLLTECIIGLIYLRFGSIDIPRQDMMAYTIIASGMLGVLLPAAIHRSFAANIAELSETCYFNTKQMVVLQMVYSGISSFVFFAVGILFMEAKWQINLIQISLYVLVPFVLSSCCCLGVLLTKTGRKNQYTFVGVGLFLGMFYMTLVSVPRVYQTAALFFWGLSLIVGVGLFGMQLAILFRYIDKGEILCMN